MLLAPFRARPPDDDPLFLPGEIVMILARDMNTRVYRDAPVSADHSVGHDNAWDDVNDDSIALFLGWANDDYALVLCSSTKTIGFTWKRYIASLRVETNRAHRTGT